MILVIATVSLAALLSVLILLVSIAVLRSEKRLECAVLRDELVDAARLGRLDVDRPRVYWLIDWFDRVAATGQMITASRHTTDRQQCTRLTESLVNALSPARQLAPVGPSFPLGTAWPGPPIPDAPGDDVEDRALRYQQEQLGRRRSGQSVRRGSPARPAAPRKSIHAAATAFSTELTSGNRSAGEQTTPQPGDQRASRRSSNARAAHKHAGVGLAGKSGGKPVGPHAPTRATTAARTLKEQVTAESSLRSLVDLSPRHQRLGRSKPTFIRPAQLLPDRPEVAPKSRPGRADRRPRLLRAGRLTSAMSPPAIGLPAWLTPGRRRDLDGSDGSAAGIARFGSGAGSGPEFAQVESAGPKQDGVHLVDARATPRPEPRRKDVRRKPLSREAAVVVTGHGKPRGALMPVTGGIALPPPLLNPGELTWDDVEPDGQQLTLTDQIFALPSQ